MSVVAAIDLATNLLKSPVEYLLVCGRFHLSVRLLMALGLSLSGTAVQPCCRRDEGCC